MKRLGLSLALLWVAACSGEGLAPSPAPSPDPEPIVSPAPEAPAAPPPAAGPAAPACDPSVPRTTPLDLAVQPEALAEPFVAVIESATRSLRVMVYQMGYGPILDGLEAKARAGVKVRVILDLAQRSVNQKYMDRLTAAGAEVLWSDPQFTYMHAKMIVADEREAVISTGNYHESFIAKERNFAVRDRDAADLEVLVRLFDADFTRAAPNLSCTRLLVSPVNGRERLLALIKSAKREIAVESMQLAERDVRSALAERKAAGVDVRVLLADPSWIDANSDAATFLAESSIPARHLKSPSVHAKALVVDAERAYVGSLNFSWTSLSKNREIGLIVDEPANVAKVRATFEKDWTAATPF
jgi:cardiolipin synthase A/B